MELIALASAPIAAALLACGLRAEYAQATMPPLFLLTIGSLALSFLGASHGRPLWVVAASAGAAVSAAGLVCLVFTVDARLAKKEIVEDFLRPPVRVPGGPSPSPSGEALFPLKRQGRAALLIFFRRDASGRLLDAAAFDPEDYA